MRLNPKIAWGLAWAGLAVIVAVPSVDFLSGRGATDTAAVLAPAPEKTAAPKPVAVAEVPAKTTSVTTTRTANGVIITPAGSPPPADPVEAFVKSGKTLPDYISDGEAPAVAATPPAPAAPTQVAAIDPTPVVTAPMPFPRPVFPATPKAAAPLAAEPVVIVDETAVTGSLGTPAGPKPPAPIVDDTANWETESLRQYLERRGILEGGSADTRSRATVTQRPSDAYDPDGFYLSDGPNNARQERQRRLYQLFEDSGESPDFTLF